MDKDYEAFCVADPVFYDTLSRSSHADPLFLAALRQVPPGWRRTARGEWAVHLPEDVELPDQGWKIHVSATLENAARILLEVWQYCVPRAIPFKFLRGPRSLLLRNAKYADRSGSGKLVTIYPVDEAALELILKELGEILAGEPGPYILSDLRWNSGPLYVRYGAFKESRAVDATGRIVRTLRTPAGEIVPDPRGPVFVTPPWVTLPDFLVPQLEARNAVSLAGLPYEVAEALHFSNGGGVYLGRDTRSGETVVLKEGRPHAGLDASGQDAVTRLERERDTLERLAGLGIAPALRDYFVIDDHHFLVEEYIDGDSLNSLLARRNPLLDLDPDRQKVADYTDWVQRICAEVERAVGLMHDRGVIYNDLHMFNILICADDSVRLIDFEVASFVEEARKPTVGSYAFTAPRDRSGPAVDRYALACLRLALFMPLTSLFRFDRGKAAQLAQVIAENFPVSLVFLADAVDEIEGAGRRKSSALISANSGWSIRLTPDTDGWERARESMTRAILESAAPSRNDRLFPGGIEQFSCGGLGFAYGAAGVLYALSVTGAPRQPEHERWLIQHANNPGDVDKLGFHDGLHGTAYVLAHLGYQDEALKLVERCLSDKWESLGSDLRGGLSGIGLNLVHLAALTGENSLSSAASRAAEIIADRLGNVESVPEISSGEHPYAGLLRGSSGPALLFIRLYEHTGHAELLDLAAVALRQDLRRCVLRKDSGRLHVDEGWRTLPYLDHGSIGIGMVLDDYLIHRDDDEFADASQAIRLAALSPYYAQSGLFAGRAGMIHYLSRRHAHGRAVTDRHVRAQIRRMEWHAVPYRGHLAFPGDQLHRLSMDLATGTAGVLLALGAALHDQPVNLPFLAPSPPART